MPSAQIVHPLAKYLRLACLALVLVATVWASNTFTLQAVLADDPCTIETSKSCTIIKGEGDPGWPASATTSTSISGFVPETAIQLQGYAAPNAFILVSEGSDVVGAGSADANGAFSFHITALQAGFPHAISLVASSGSQVTPGTGFVVTPIANTITTVSNILLPSFIDVTPRAQQSGQPIDVEGYTVPGGLVTLFIEDAGGTIDTQVTADANGYWHVELISEFGNLAEGSYEAYAVVSYTGGLMSEPSQRIPFEIRAIATTTFLTVNGYGAPGAFLNFRANGNPIGTDIIPGNGHFTKTLSFPDANASIALGITADNGDATTPELVIHTSVVMHNTTTINDVLLTTFIDVNPNLSQVGDPILVFGEATPNSTIELHVSGQSPVNIPVDANGIWQQDIIAHYGTFPVGTYTAYAFDKYDPGTGLLTSPQSRTITFQVHTVETATDLIIKGFGAPGTFVSIIENNQVVGTTTVKPDGTFEHTVKFPDISLNRTVSVRADNGTQITPDTSFNVSLVAFNATTVANIMLPTFVDVVPRTTPYGNTTTIKGQTAPNSMIQVYVRNPIIDHPVISDNNGFWEITVSTINGGDHLNVGRYIAYARSQKMPEGYMSAISAEVEFEITDTDNCSARRSDLNCDGLVNITDLGILIFYWGNAGAGQKADINQDGVVDISDVGILVYDWTY